MNGETTIEECKLSNIKVYPHVPKEDDGSRGFARIRDCGPHRFLVIMISPRRTAYQEGVDLMSRFVRELHRSICSKDESSNDDAIIGAAIVGHLRMERGRIIGYIGLRDHPELSRDMQTAADEVVDHIYQNGYRDVGSHATLCRKLKLSKVYCYKDPEGKDVADIMERATRGGPWEDFKGAENHVYEVGPNGLKY